MQIRIKYSSDINKLKEKIVAKVYTKKNPKLSR